MNKTKEMAGEIFKTWIAGCNGLGTLTKEERLEMFELVATWALEAAITFEHTEL